ncbi:collagen alpha-1(XII) chain-like [Saccostrea cucullata]|uniref:collagen alpha-1(XII) chain-like n=1 Tax=Saccostrea cuccullata TaxID=36930 RepID=UPI002ED2B832
MKSLLLLLAITVQVWTQVPKGCRSKLDIVILLDASYSEGQVNFNKLLQFVENFVNQFNIGPDSTQISVVPFATSVYNAFSLNTHSTKSSLISAIRNIPYKPGTTYIDKALTYVETSSFLPRNGGRSDAEKLVFLLTYGHWSNQAKTTSEAQRLHFSGVEVFAVGIGRYVSNFELESIASDYTNVFQVQTFDELDTIQSQLTNAACQQAALHCQSTVADIVFALDSSSSFSTIDYSKQLLFIKHLIRQYDVGSNETQFSVVSFDSRVHVEFPLNSYKSKTQVLGAISNITYHYAYGSTNASEALKYIASNSFTSTNGGRAGVERWVIVITDGTYSYSPAPATSATSAATDKLHKMGVGVISIGVGSRSNMEELQALATDPHHVFKLDTYDDLFSVMTNIESRTCDFNACHGNKADIVFLLDSSASEGSDNFNYQLQFLQNLTLKFDIGPEALQIALATFSTKPYGHFWLDTYQNKTDLMNAIGNIPYIPGSTYTDLGLKFALNESFSSANGARDESIPKILVVLTDGQSTDPMATALMADRLHQQDIRVITIGIGQRVRRSELTVIATDKYHVFTVSDFKSLASVQKDLQIEICRNEEPSTECGDKEADIVFILDDSGTEGASNFKKELNFTADFMKGFQIGKQHVQFGLVTYSSYARNQFYFNTYHDLQSILHKLDTITYIGGTTRTEYGLSSARYQFQSYHGARLHAQKIVIILRNGMSYSTTRTIEKANEMKALGVKVISVGIGKNVSHMELNGIATDLQHAFTAADFDALPSLLFKIKSAACSVPNPRVIDQECGERDIVFFLDSSRSKRKINFNKMLTFVQNFTKKFDIGPQNVQVGVVTFSTSVHERIKLDQYSDKTALLAAISGIYYDGGGLYTDKALQYARTQAFLPSHGGRPNASRIVVVMTDGLSFTHAKTLQEAAALKSQPNMKVIAIGIGPSVNQQEINSIGSDSQHVFYVPNFDVLNKLNSELEFTSCQTCGFIQTADIIFALDSSSRIGLINLQKEMDFVQSFVRDLPVGPHNVQFSVVSFGSVVQNIFYLNQYSQKRPILDAVQQTDFVGGSTQTSKVLKYIREHNILPVNGARSNSSLLVVVLAESTSTNKSATLMEANLLKAYGATVVAIGIGSNVDNTELNSIASDPNHVFKAQNFDTLQNIKEDIKKVACESVNLDVNSTMPTVQDVTRKRVLTIDD